MFDNKCSQYWSQAEYLPVDDILEYWCDGVRNGECWNAKKYALIAACGRGEVKYRRNDGKNWNDPVADLIDRGVVLIHRESFEKWADVSFAIVGKQTLQAPFLDPNHKYYSKELALAVTAWLTLYGDNGKFQSFKGHIDQIKATLAGNDLSTNMIEQIATVVNPNKTGGAPSTGY
jgi:hypothetical protein